MSETIFLEWCSKPQARNGNFAPEAEVVVKTGFRSVYGFKEKPTASKGLSQFPVYSDVLFVDFDDGLDGGAVALSALLKRNGVGYRSYKSGGKGVHFHIDILPMFGVAVPYSQKVFVQSIVESADVSIYRHSSLIRLPGTIHDKTGAKKELIEEVVGVPLSIETVEPTSRFSNVHVAEDTLKLAFIRVANIINEEPETGMRTNTIWSIAKNLKDAGVSFDSGLEIMQLVNESWRNPKEDGEVLRAFKDAYKD